MKNALVVLFAVLVAVSFTVMAARLPERSGSQPAELPPVELPELMVAPEPGLQPAVDRTSAGPATPIQLANGARVYRTLCVSCHLPDGKGMLTAVPPLAGSDYMQADRARVVRGVLQGISGPITVNQAGYNGVMPPLGAVLSDRQVADVLTYVFNSWGNQGDAFDPESVGAIRAQAATP